MDTTRIHQLLQNPDIATESDLKSLEYLSEQYAWSSFIKILIARISQHFDHADQGLKLNSAAIYASDRGNLKKYITDAGYRLLDQANIGTEEQLATAIREADHGPFVQESTGDPAYAPIEDAEDAQSTKTPEHYTAAAEQGNTRSSPVFVEVLQNIARLRSRIQNFNIRWNKEPEPGQESVYRPPEEHSQYPDAESSSTSEELIDLPALESSEISSPEAYAPGVEPISGHSDQNPRPTGDQLVPDRTYQDRLIDRFIQRSSGTDFASVPAADPKGTSNPEDLAQNSTRLNENAISENLAWILFNQGKIEMAVDIYRKLIWKFPQKKAYFAGQIDKILSSK